MNSRDFICNFSIKAADDWNHLFFDVVEVYRARCDVTKVKLENFKNFQIFFLDFRLLLFQPENVL